MQKHIVILGGGIAGVEAAIRVSGYGYQVTLVSDRDYLFIYPISIWVPVGKKKFEEVILPLDLLGQKHSFNLVVDTFTGIDTVNNKILFRGEELSFDYLILAIGMGKLKPKGIEHTHAICGEPEASINIKKALEKLVERGSGKIAIGFGGNPKDKSAVRGGPAFEMLFNFSHYLKKKGIRNNFEITFFAPMPEPGKRMGPVVLKKLPAYFNHYGCL